MIDKSELLLPEDPTVTARYAVGWNIGKEKQSSNISTFLWCYKCQRWHSVVGFKFEYHPAELKSSGMFIIEKLGDNDFIHEVTSMYGSRDTGKDIGNWCNSKRTEEI